MTGTKTARDLRPALTVDIVVLAIRGGRLQALLVRRGRPPFEGRWALPGGFVDPGESLEDAARRELREETAVSGTRIEQLHTFGDPGRDPRGRVVSVAHLALVPAGDVRPVAADDADEVRWCPAGSPPPLAFDHDEILRTAVERLRGSLPHTTLALGLLPEEFTLGELQEVYEVLLGRSLDKRNFRRKILASGILEPRDGVRRRGRHRPARIYSPHPDRERRLREKGTTFTF